MKIITNTSNSSKKMEFMRFMRYRKKGKGRKEEGGRLAHGWRTSPAPCYTSSTPSSSSELEEKATLSTFFNLEFPWNPSSISLHAASPTELLHL